MLCIVEIGSPAFGDTQRLSPIWVHVERVRSECLLLRGRLGTKRGFLESSPFVILLVPFANDIPLLTLGARRLRLVAF